MAGQTLCELRGLQKTPISIIDSRSRDRRGSCGLCPKQGLAAKGGGRHAVKCEALRGRVCLAVVACHLHVFPACCHAALRLSNRDTEYRVVLPCPLLCTPYSVGVLPTRWQCFGWTAAEPCAGRARKRVRQVRQTPRGASHDKLAPSLARSCPPSLFSSFFALLEPVNDAFFSFFPKPVRAILLEAGVMKPVRVLFWA